MHWAKTQLGMQTLPSTEPGIKCYIHMMQPPANGPGAADADKSCCPGFSMAQIWLLTGIWQLVQRFTSLSSLCVTLSNKQIKSFKGKIHWEWNLVSNPLNSVKGFTPTFSSSTFPLSVHPKIKSSLKKKKYNICLCISILQVIFKSELWLRTLVYHHG